MAENKRHPAGETQIERDLAVIRRVAARDAAIRAGHPCVQLREETVKPEPRVHDHEVGMVTPIEQVVYCTACGRHVVSEIGQTCPHCNRP